MGRPRTFDRDVALASALQLFWRNGYKGTSISDLTTAMGIAPPSLYAAFGDKRQLFDEAADLYQSHPASFSTRALQEPTARAAIARLLHDAALEYTKAGQPRGCLILSEPLLGRHREQSRHALIERLQRGRTDGDLDVEVDIDALADYITVVLSGLSAQARYGADHVQLIAAADAAMRAWPDS
ncbi:TetR/AcrR family transcriptional regulator [Microbacterium aurantiacum]|uniref:TetR/AcrR family transcriptional regulator n=1 Tax=Microbacterium aurantiacum TaxID=162393 RepID=UPI000C807FEA|nr:TetR/AcrR family transcriptional regulator [Microbacterium aurantiacum]